MNFGRLGNVFPSTLEGERVGRLESVIFLLSVFQVDKEESERERGETRE